VTTLTGTSAFVRLALRRDRAMLASWIYILAGLIAGTAYGFKKLYPTQAGRAEFAAVASQNPALLALYGPLYGDSIGSLTAWRYGAFAAVGAGLMSVFVVVRHTRADEEAGRLELLGSASVGRNAALAAAIAISAGANLVLAVVLAAGLIALGLPAAGSIALAVVIGACGLTFTAVAAVTAQLAETARAARGIAIALLGAGYLLRAVGDAAGASGPNWLTWLSPVGWTELIRPFAPAKILQVPCQSPLRSLHSCFVPDGIRWWVLVLPVAMAIMATVVAGVLAARRDHGAGLLPQRPGPARGAASLRSPLALAWRLQRGTLIGWVCGGFVGGAVTGAAAKGISGLLGSSQIRRVFAKLGGQAAFTDAYLAAIVGFLGLIAAGYAVGAVLRLRSEETEERADPVLATSTSRIRWGLSHLMIAAGGTLVLLTAMGFGAGLGFVARSGGGGHQIAVLIGAGLAQLPAALLLAGIATALIGLAPRFSVAGGWAALGAVILLLFLGALLKLSHWVLDISPFTHLPKLPGGAVTVAPLVWLSVIAAALTVVGLLGLRRRDIG
jgi:ABC-2 type transport system permease protein